MSSCAQPRIAGRVEQIDLGSPHMVPSEQADHFAAAGRELRPRVENKVHQDENAC